MMTDERGTGRRKPGPPDLSHLLAHTTNIIVADLIQLLLILTLDGLTLTEDLSVRSYNAVLCRNNI